MITMAELQQSFKASSLFSTVVSLLWLSIIARTSMAATREVRVGVILDLNSTLGIMVNYSLDFAVQDYYSAHQDAATKIHLIVRNVSQNNVLAAALAAINLTMIEKVDVILGPQNSEQARFIVALGEAYQKPVIWFPITGPSLLPPPSLPSIYSGEDLNCFQFQAIAATIKALGWQSIVPIYEKSEYGSNLLPCLADVLKHSGIRMANLTAIDSDDKIINSTLDKLNKMRTHVFLVHMSMDFGTTFIRSAQKKDMMGEGYAWMLTQELSSLTDPRAKVERKLYDSRDIGKKDPQDHGYVIENVPLKRFMQGALGVRPMDLKRTNKRKERERNFTNQFKSHLTIYGWWAYHTIEALAKAVEEAGTNGTTLREKILETNFTSNISDVRFNLNQGQLDQSEYEVYNVIGDRERIIGFWIPKSGLVQNYTEEGGGGDKASGGRKYKLKDPLWPGDTLDKPPKLRIGVPRTSSFPEFVNADNSSDGFAINVFLKALDVLPFPLYNYKFVRLPNTSRSHNTTYDDMLCTQMKDEDLDAIIGDITIVASRTKCVDFTLPYLDSSVAMVVRVKDASKSTGILFKPFNLLLWLILGGIFGGATIVIIVLERNKANGREKNGREKIEEFRSNPFLVYKIDGMENFESRAAGWMVILTSFLFILVLQVYTANLTSILTQGKEKEPTFKNEYEINKSSNLRVGYQNGSWVRELLTEQLGFSSSRLIALTSREEYNSSLSNGTEKGGVDAIFDETPYLTLFLSRYKSHFMMTGPIYKTGGFAFAFPRKSGLVSHFSNAILNVTQDGEPFRLLMAKSSLPTSIEDLQFEDQNDIETSSLTIANFGGGFYPVLVSVVALFLCLSILNPSVSKWLRERPAILNQLVIKWFRNKKQFFKSAKA